MDTYTRLCSTTLASPTRGRNENTFSLPHSRNTLRNAAELVSKSAGQARAMCRLAYSKSVVSYDMYSTKSGRRLYGYTISRRGPLSGGRHTCGVQPCIAARSCHTERGSA